MGVGDDLRQAIENSGWSLYRVAKDSGIPYAAIHHFMSGRRSLSLATVEKLADLFQMRLTKPHYKRGRPGE